MANEINISQSLAIIKGNYNFNFTPNPVLADLTSEASAGGNQLIAGTAEALDLNTDVLANGIAYFQNLNTSIPIEIGISGYTQTTAAITTMISLFRLNPGESCIARPATTNVFAKAITTAGTTQAYLSFQIFSP